MRGSTTTETETGNLLKTQIQMIQQLIGKIYGFRVIVTFPCGSVGSVLNEKQVGFRNKKAAVARFSHDCSQCSDHRAQITIGFAMIFF